jgi:hypothetical protein
VLRRIAPVLIVLGSLLVVPVQALGGKLVVFHNGRTIKAAALREDAGWTFLSLGETGEMGVPTRLIAAVLESKDEEKDPIPNVQASAGGGAPGPVRPAGRAGGVAAVPVYRADPIEEPPPPEPDTSADEQAAAEARREALSRQAAQARNQQRGLVPGDPSAPAQPQPGTDLSGVTTPPTGRWPSLLDQARQRARGEASGDTEEPEEDPER